MMEGGNRGDSFSQADFRVGIRTLARLARLAEQTCQGAGISLPQYRLLVSISGRPQRASELALRVGVSRPTLTSLVSCLERDGLLTREPVPGDRRGILLEVTDSGREAVERAEAALTRRLAPLMEPRAARKAVDFVVALRDALEREDGGRVSARG